MFGLFKSQTVYTVHEQPEPPADREERAERLRFIREGFSLFAFLLAPVWMIANRLWLVLIGYVLLMGALQGLITLFEVPDHWRYYASLAVNLLVGFEADTLQRWTLYRRSWRMVSTVSGSNFNECERRFFDTWVPNVPMVTPANFDRAGTYEARPKPPPTPPRSGEVISPKRTGWTSWRRT